MMIKKIMTLMFLLTFSFGLFANERGNGGATVVCKSINGEITQIKLVDLYLWEILEGLEFNREYSKPDEVVQLARKRLMEVEAYDFIPFFDRDMFKVNDGWALLPPGANVLPANDNPVVLLLPPGCQPFYIANIREINGRTKVLVNRDITSHPFFTTLQLGALKVHESVYSITRRVWKDTDSTRAQEITAFLTADSLTVEQMARLKELTDVSFYEDNLENVKVTALKSFMLQLWEFTIDGRIETFTTQLLDGEVFKIPFFDSMALGTWYYAGMYTRPLKINQGDIFNIVDTRHSTFMMKRVTGDLEVAIGVKKSNLNLPKLREINSIGFFKAEYNY